MSDGASVLINGRYLLLEPVGQGGFGRVWRGRDQLLEREVAVKEVLLPPNLPKEARDELLSRTMREARAAARLSHPGIITVHDVAEHDGAPWIVMELVSGPSLRAEIKRHGHLPWQQVAVIGQQVAEALAQAHAAGIVHRDLKPDNILLSGQRAIVTDFGIAHLADASARLTGSGAIIGTPHYMAPEQFEDRHVSFATDMWALGATLYDASEGRVPFDGSTLTALITAVLTKSPDPAAHAGPLTPVIDALLAKDPARRPDALAVARALASSRAYAPVSPLAARAVPAPGQAPGPDGATSSRAAASRTPPPGVNSAREPARQGARHTRGRVTSRTITISAAAGATVIAAAIVLPLTFGGHGSASGSNPPATATKSTTPPTSRSAGSHGPITASLAAAITVPNETNGFYSAALTPDGKTLAACDYNGQTYLWGTATRKLTATLTPSDIGIGGSCSVAFAPGGKILAYHDNSGHTYLWDVATQAVTASFPDPSSGSSAGNDGIGGNSVAFAPDGKTLAASNSDGYTYIWDAATGIVTATLADPNGSSVTSVAFAPDGKTLATGDSAGYTCLWDIATKTVTAKLSDPNSGSSGSTTGVTSVAFAPDGRALAFANKSGHTYLWNPIAKTGIATLADPSGDPVHSVTFAPDSATLATGNELGTIYLWDTATGKMAATLPNPRGSSTSGFIYSLAFTPDGKTLAAAVDNNYSYVWRVTGA
jgi:serine/threonine protein kinase/WD40 repeat protein